MSKPFRLAQASLFALLALPGLHAQGTPPGPCFGGTGGPNGDFDWVVRTGDTFILDTTFTQIVGGPNGAATAVLDVIGGVVDLRNLVIEVGGEVRVQGPNPLRILATGDVVIRGQLDLSGFRANSVATLNTGNIVELGASGGPGGGRGGNANVNTTASSPRGGAGTGAFGVAGGGGQGGESAYAPANLGKDARRPGGGGGGRFAADRLATAPFGLSLAASAGNPGHPSGRGAESGVSPAQGGAAGSAAFVDAKPGNDFFGLRPITGGSGVLAVVRGELPGVLAGSGGGGGGNAVPSASFPNPSFNFSSDEKGGPGGGGGGALHVKAVGRIVFGAEGEILCNGGLGGTGENTNFLDHIGGTGGAGSGGHVVLESAAQVDFTDGGANTGGAPRNWIEAAGRPLNKGSIADVNACCRTYSNGGASGGGVVQLHVPRASLPPGTDPAKTDILVPASVAVERDPLAHLAVPRPYVLFPTCASFLRAGLAGVGAGAPPAIGLVAWTPFVAPSAVELSMLELPRRP
jgi:hypothetical protein